MLLFISLFLLSSAVQGLKQGKLDRETQRHGKICIGTKGRMSVPNNREHHYRNLRDRYTNCTYVDGNLELTWLQDKSLDLSFLQHIREVTGYVLISHVDVPKIVLPSLQIIRGRTLFKLSVRDDEFSLMVTLSKMHNLEMPALRDILEGSVGVLNNYNLCHIKTIEWDEIITGSSGKYVYVYNFNEPERDCTPCHESCEAGCWGEGPHNCQKFSKINCSPQCHKGRCFGNQPRECCHLFCAGGCTGPKQSDCLACRNFFDEGVCKQECPPMHRYNPIKYRWEKNPEGKYAYGATCVKECPKHLLKDNGACVRVCPPKKKTVNGECVPCDGPCPKTCHFNEVIHAGNINSFQNCTVIEGSIVILDSTFNGFQQVYDNYTFGPRYPAMDPQKLEIFSTLKEVTGYINIQGHHPNFKNLNAFRNLEVIGGRTLTEYFSALYIVKTALTSLGLTSLRKIRSGAVSILENKDLCYAQEINWSKIMKSPSHNTLLQNNKSPQLCYQEGHVCDPQCSSEGCWGPGNKSCLSCNRFQVDNECILSCDPHLGLYKVKENKCMKCDKECDLTCRGPGPGNCDKCKHTRDGPFCVSECPKGKYHNSTFQACMPCHENCIEGCQGHENTIGSNGCNSCERAVISKDLEIKQCLGKEESCPLGYFDEWVVRQIEGRLKPLAGKAICRPCHPLCKRCNGYGFHDDVCQECISFHQDSHCVTSCSNDHYAEGDKCKPCADECRGCYGPGLNQCRSCKNYKLFSSEGSDGNQTYVFNCTQNCPVDRPNKILPEQGGDPFCSAHPLHSSRTLTAPNSIPAIIGGLVGCIILLGIFLSVFGYQWRQRAKAKENTAKMTMVMTGYEDNEPLRPTNIKPNLAKLKIVREAELRRGGILGYGAFGTVYKGVWVPEGENVKIPVAVKVLREGTGSNANKEILEEAYIMASVEHPNLLQLLAVCMTSQMMLVTQLMPLGCLLDYVRNNKDKIGSKPLLNWCTQIARGMAYLEERRLVHRDLAARNVLVQTPSCVKITDFGLAKLLDINEDEYKAAGGKMPIKWLALECIQHRIFTHKSDVWAFGVTVWELLTYGGRPYENIPARDVPDLLEKGERLAQPPICTIDVYMILIKCWMVDAECRPLFRELAEEFAKMARDPGRYLVIPGDKLMRLPSYTTQDERELIRNLSSNIGGSEVVIAAEEYLNPGGRSTTNNPMSNNNNNSTPVDTPLPTTPTQKFFPSNAMASSSSMALPHLLLLPPPSYHDANSRTNPRYGSTTGVNDGFSTLGSRSLRYGSNFLTTSCDPLKMLEDDNVDSTPNPPNVGGTLPSQKSHGSSVSSVNSHRHGLRLNLPLDDEEYLVPSPHSPQQQQQQQGSTPNNNNSSNSNNNNNAYMDLISDPKNQTMFPYPPPQSYFLTDNPSNYGRVPDFMGSNNRNVGGGFISMDNPEYILNNNEHQKNHSRGNYHTLGIPFVPNPSSPSASSSQGPSSIPSVGKPSFSSSSEAAAVTSSYPMPPPVSTACMVVANSGNPGLNGVINCRSSAEDSDDHDYYNDFDRLKRELQPLHPRTTTTTAASASSSTALPSKHETTV